MAIPFEKTSGALGLNRRRFLKAASAAVGVLAIPCHIPARALGKNGAVAPSERIVLGGIGLGGRGSGDLSAMLGESDVQVVAVCDVKKTQRLAMKNMVDGHYGTKGCAAYGDLRQLLAERTDIDAVLIATGDRWHAPAAVRAMRAGKDVYCEKPSCLTIEQGRLVVETARNYGRVYQTGAQRLSEANHVFAIEMARTGMLGPIHTAYADCRWRDGLRRDWLPAEPLPSKDDLDWDAFIGPCPWRPYNPGYLSGGWYHFYDFATDVAMWGAHTVAQVLPGLDLTGVSTIQFQYDSPDGSMVTRFSNGLKVVLARGPNGNYWNGSCGERFDGPEGWAAAADGYSRPDVSSPALLSHYKKIIGDYLARTQHPMNHIRDFLNCVRSRRTTVANPEVMYHSMVICLAADVCEQLQRNLTFDLHKAEFVGDAEANRFRSRAMREPWCV